MEITGICEFCYRAFSGKLPKGWDIVWQCYICLECKKKVEETDGGYWTVKCGAYSQGPDPRA